MPGPCEMPPNLRPQLPGRLGGAGAALGWPDPPDVTRFCWPLSACWPQHHPTVPGVPHRPAPLLLCPAAPAQLPAVTCRQVTPSREPISPYPSSHPLLPLQSPPSYSILPAVPPEAPSSQAPLPTLPPTYDPVQGRQAPTQPDPSTPHPRAGLPWRTCSRCVCSR